MRFFLLYVLIINSGGAACDSRTRAATGSSRCGGTDACNSQFLQQRGRGRGAAASFAREQSRPKYMRCAASRASPVIAVAGLLSLDLDGWRGLNLLERANVRLDGLLNAQHRGAEGSLHAANITGRRSGAAGCYSARIRNLVDIQKGQTMTPLASIQDINQEEAATARGRGGGVGRKHLGQGSFTNRWQNAR